MTRRSPSLVVVGAPKCGTTSLHDFFSAHPQSFVHRQSELHWWARPELEAHAEGPGDRRSLRAVCATQAEYDAAFADMPSDARVIVETSPSYLHWPDVAGRLTGSLPGVRIVVVIRDPARRAWSQYWHQVRAGVEPLDFESALDAETSRSDRRWGDLWRYLGHSFYADGIRRYQQLVGSTNVLVLDAETLGSNESAARLQRFAGIEATVGTVQQVHRGGQPRSGTLTSLLHSAAPIGRTLLPNRIRHRVRDLATRALTTPVPPLPPAIAERLVPVFASDQATLRTLRQLEMQPNDG